jgi:predicted RNA binding protein YcfA (HicA-like mRNA interferase family)
VKPLTGKQFCRLLEREGQPFLRITGSHHVYGKPGERSRLSVPVSSRLCPRPSPPF